MQVQKIRREESRKYLHVQKSEREKEMGER